MLEISEMKRRPVLVQVHAWMFVITISFIQQVAYCEARAEGSGDSYSTNVQVTGVNGGPFNIGATVAPTPATASTPMQSSAPNNSGCGAPATGGCTGASNGVMGASPVSTNQTDAAKSIFDSVQQQDQINQMADPAMRARAQQIFNAIQSAMQNDPSSQLAQSMAQSFATTMQQALTAAQISAQLDSLNAQMQNNQALRNAINAPVPPPVYDPNDPATAQMNQASQNSDYDKMAEKAEEADKDNPRALRQDLLQARNRALDVLDDSTSSTAAKNKALGFINGIPGRLNELAGGIGDDVDPSGSLRDALRKDATQTQTLHDQFQDVIRRKQH